MNKYTAEFVEKGLAYKGGQYDFLLFKDLVEYVRQFDLLFKIGDLREELIKDGWSEKKISVSTTEGYMSKDVWTKETRFEKTRSLPVDDRPRRTLVDEEYIEADRVLSKIFNTLPATSIKEISIHDDVLVFSNKGLKEAVELVGTIGDISSIASVIRSKAEKLFVGERFFGVSSRTVSYKNYYKIKR